MPENAISQKRIRINPYIAGNPVGGGDAFVGRSDILQGVANILANPNVNTMVLYGQRRIGKTSVLLELITNLSKKKMYYPIYFDLQDKAAWTVAQVLEELAVSLAQKLGLGIPTSLGDDALLNFRNKFIPNILDYLPPGSSFVLLFDEFDVLDNANKQQAGVSFFRYLRNLLDLDTLRLQFIFAIGRRPEELTSETLSIFKGVKSFHVSLMRSEETTTLIRLSENNKTLYWPDEAISYVQTLTGGHPLLTQQLCYEVWDRVYRHNPESSPTVHSDDVETVASVALDSITNALEWLWDGLGPAERIVTSALAGVGPIAINQDELEKLLLDSGVRILVSELQNAPHLLQTWDLIESTNNGYHFRVELLRRWLAKNKPLTRVWEELDHLLPIAENLFQAARTFYQKGGDDELEEATSLLRQAIRLNPNHWRSSQLLADVLLSRKKLKDAKQLLENIYKYRPNIAHSRLVQVLLLLAKESILEEDQLALFNQILELETTHPEALAGKERASIKLEQKPKLEDWYQQALDALKNNNRQVAQKLLAKVISIDPSYRQAAYHLYQIVNDLDVPDVSSELEGLRAIKPEVVVTTQGVTETENQRQVKKWQKQLLVLALLFVVLCGSFWSIFQWMNFTMPPHNTPNESLTPELINTASSTPEPTDTYTLPAPTTATATIIPTPIPNTPTITSVITNTPASLFATATIILTSTSTSPPTATVYPMPISTPTSPKPPTSTTNPTTISTILFTTPTVHSTPTPDFSVGMFTLKPMDKPSYGLTEFEWKWTGPLPAGFGFEIRVWRENELQLGVHNAELDNTNGMIEQMGENQYRLVTDITNAPGVREQPGEYLWTVLLVQIAPNYTDSLGIQAEPSRFRFEPKGGGDSGGGDSGGGDSGGGDSGGGDSGGGDSGGNPTPEPPPP